MVGPIYRPIKYASVYAGVGVGIHEGRTSNSIPNFGFDWEAGVMGHFMNATISMGVRYSKWGSNSKRTTFVFGVGGYLKRYFDEKMGYCSNDNRRWWSLNYMTRPVVNGKGVMFGDIGKTRIRGYVKAMYWQLDEPTKGVEASGGIIFTPVDGIIDFMLGGGCGFTPVDGIIDFMLGGGGGAETDEPLYVSVDVETGFILNLWRFPLTVLLHESNLLRDERHLYVDFGIGFHLGDFKRSSYK